MTLMTLKRMICADKEICVNLLFQRLSASSFIA